MTNKILLAKNESRGNLITPEFKQSYYVYFLPRVVEGDKVVYCEKGRFTISAPSSNGEEVTKSYQMIDPAQERLLILDVIKLYLFHKNVKGELNDFTLSAFQNDIAKKIKELGVSVMRGEFDNGI